MSDTENEVKTEEVAEAVFSTPPTSASKDGQDSTSSVPKDSSPIKNGKHEEKDSDPTTKSNEEEVSTTTPTTDNDKPETKESTSPATNGEATSNKGETNGGAKDKDSAAAATLDLNGSSEGKDDSTSPTTSAKNEEKGSTSPTQESNGDGDSKAGSPKVKQGSSSEVQLNPRVAAWKSKGSFHKFRDYDIFCYLQTGASTGPLVVLLHGYPSSSYDFRDYLELEKDQDTILCIDLLGFGLSDKPVDHDYTLSGQADLVEEMVRQLNPTPNGPVFIVAHDMSTSVAAELFARDLEGKLSINVIGALLFNGNMIMDRAKLILGQKLLRTKFGSLFSRFTNSMVYRWQLGSVFSREHAMSREEGDDQWNIQCYKGGQRILHKLISYTFERVTHAERWHGAIKNWEKPLSFAWGMEDPVSTTNQFEGWKNLRPHAETHEMTGLGHYPQIESPKVFKDVVDAVLEKIAEKK